MGSALTAALPVAGRPAWRSVAATTGFGLPVLVAAVATGTEGTAGVVTAAAWAGLLAAWTVVGSGPWTGVRVGAARVALALAAVAVVGPAVGRAAVLLSIAVVWVAERVGAPRSWPTTVALIGVQIVWWSGAEVAASVLAAGLVAVVLERPRLLVERPTVLALAGPPVRRWLSGIARAAHSLQRLLTTRPAAAAVVAGAASLPLFAALTGDPSTRLPRIAGFYNDFPSHLEVAARLGFDPFFVSPHPLFHVAARLGGAVAPVIGPATFLAACVAAAYVGLVRLGRSPHLGRLDATGAAAFAAFVLVAESPTALLAALGLVDADTSFAPVHVWNSPTETVGLAATLLLLPILLDVLARVSHDADADAGAEHRRLAIVVALATAAKPSFTPVLAAALPLHLAPHRRLRHRSSWRLLMAVWLPVGLVAAVQAGVIAMAPPEYRVGVVFDPLAGVEHFGVGRSGPLYFLAPVIVLLALAVDARSYLRQPAVRLAWTALGLSLVPMFLLSETGPFAAHGNVGKPAIICWLVVFTVSAKFVVVRLVDRTSSGTARRTGWRIASWGYLAASAGAGVAVWLAVVADVGHAV